MRTSRMMIVVYLFGLATMPIVVAQTNDLISRSGTSELNPPGIKQQDESTDRMESNIGDLRGPSKVTDSREPESRQTRPIRVFPTTNEESRFSRVAVLTAIAVGLLFALVVCFQQLRRVQNRLLREQSEGEKQRQLRDALELRVQRLQRMESLGMLAGGIAHDFNNLLLGVIGNAELLKRWKFSEEPDFIDQRAQQILVAAGKAADLSRQMLTYAGKQNTLRKRHDLNVISMEFSRVLQSGLDDIRQLRFELFEQPLFALTDRTQIEQVLLNIVANAGHATGGNGQITIRTGREMLTRKQIKADSRLFGTRTNEGDFVFIEVEDSGIGIPPEDLDHIFEPFFGKSESGRGLGLAVVYGLVSAHEGLVRIVSEVGVGTCIRVLIPESAPDLTAGVEPYQVAPLTIEQGATPELFSKPVLVIDDDPIVLSWIKLALDLEGCTATTADSGLSLFNEFTTNDLHAEPIHFSRLEPFSCLILDVQMPEMTGQEVLAELQQRGIRIPVILMSGYSPTKIDQLRADSNVVAVLSKPFQIGELINAIKSVTHGQYAS